MNATEKRMAQNMEALLAAHGYHVTFRFTPKSLIATIPTMFNGATTTVEFHQLQSPADVVWEIQKALDAINRKAAVK